MPILNLKAASESALALLFPMPPNFLNLKLSEKNMDVKDFLKAVSARRSNYKLEGSSPIPGGEITEIVREIVRNSPSAFNSQSSRVAILFSESAKKFWEIVFETLSPKTPPENAAAFRDKIDSFAAAYGTILFFDDEKVTNATAEKFPEFAKNFPLWAQQSNAMIQFAVWCALTAAGLGANLQHYNPAIDEAVREEYGFPVRWKLIAQMPFGSPAEPPAQKPDTPIGSRVIVI